GKRSTGRFLQAISCNRCRGNPRRRHGLERLAEGGGFEIRGISRKMQCSGTESNHRHADFQSAITSINIQSLARLPRRKRPCTTGEPPLLSRELILTCCPRVARHHEMSSGGERVWPVVGVILWG